MASGHGAILLTAHFGYGRIIQSILESAGHKVLVIGRDQKASDRELTRFALAVSRLLKTSNFQGRDIDSGMNLRPLLAALARNQIILTTGDGGFTTSAVWASVWKQLFSFSASIYSVARTSGAVLLPVFVVDDDPAKGGFNLVIGEALTLRPAIESDPSSDVEEFIHPFESFILRYPHLLDWRKRGRFTKRHLAGRIRRGSQKRKRVGLQDAIKEIRSHKS